MSNIQAPMCAHHPRTRKDVAFSWPELPLAHPDAIPLHGVFLEGENAFMRRKAEQIVQCKLQTYQAAAVVSTVLAGVESQLLVFFKTSPNFPQQPAPPMLSYLFVLTYVALIFSVSSTISSLVLTRAFGNVTIPVECLRAKIKGMAKPRFRFPLVQTRFGDRGPLQRRKWIECHWLFTLLVSVLCLPTQIILYIWMQERDAIRATISVAGVFAMLPLLDFLPMGAWKSLRDQGTWRLNSSLPLFPGTSHWVNSEDSLMPVPVSSHSPDIYTAYPAAQVGH